MELHALLRAGVDHLGVSQAAFAREVGVSPTLVSRWLNADDPVIPSSENCMKIAEVIGMDPLVVMAAAGHYVSKEVAADPEWEMMQRELRAIYESFDRSRWADLTATIRGVSVLVGASPKELEAPSPKSVGGLQGFGQPPTDDHSKAANSRRVNERVPVLA